MIKTRCCTDCICLPACISKPTNRLLPECIFIRNTIANISAGLKEGRSIDIYFRDLHRHIDIERGDRLVFIKSDVDVNEKWIVYNRKTLQSNYGK